MLFRYLSDLQAKVARLEQRSGHTSSACQAPTTANDAVAQAEGENLPQRDDIQQLANPPSFEATRDNSPTHGPDPHEANLVNPLIESSKFMSSSSGRACKLKRHPP
jgi:proline utilization trans-activator